MLEVGVAAMIVMIAMFSPFSILLLGPSPLLQPPYHLDMRPQVNSKELGKLQKAKDAVFGDLGEASVGLTGAQLEEEALLILIREKNKETGGASDEVNVSNRGHGCNISSSIQSTANLLAEFELDSSESSSDETGDMSQHVGHGGAYAMMDSTVPVSTQHSELEDVSTVEGQSTGTVSIELDKTKKRKLQTNVVNKVLKLWVEHTTRTLAGIRDAQQRSRATCISTDGEVSIVVSKPGGSAVECFFVRWTNSDEMEGRTVRVDQRNRVVWSPSTLFGKPIPTRVLDPVAFDILVTASGAKCLKMRDERRDSLPDAMIRFVQFTRVLAMMFNKDGLQGPFSKRFESI